jgi:predicted kinase
MSLAPEQREIANRFLLPQAPDYRVAWDELDERFPWIQEMRGAVQDPIWHAEGDVWIHTRMVCEELAASQRWRDMNAFDNLACWLGALLHDVAKPYSTQFEGKRIRSRHHSPRGAIHARGLLWEAGASTHLREEVCGIIRHHQLPVHAMGKDLSEQRVLAASLRCKMSNLAMVAIADIRGRVSEQRNEHLESIEFFQEYCQELSCWAEAAQFPSDHTRFLHFNHNRSSRVQAYDDTTCTATLLSGLPGTGKTHWRRTHRPTLPVVCLDDIRGELGVEPGKSEAKVQQVAKELARVHLRQEADFIWDATNLSAKRRRKLVSLFRRYGARIEIVSVETPYKTLWSQNRNRDAFVPEGVIRHMVKKWEMPDLTEAHKLLQV